jgi:hypothetical protein
MVNQVKQLHFDVGMRFSIDCSTAFSVPAAAIRESMPLKQGDANGAILPHLSPSASLMTYNDPIRVKCSSALNLKIISSRFSIAL